MHSPSALLRLIRWENALIAAAGVLVGAWWVGGDPASARSLAATVAAVALAAVANAWNDLEDVEIDRTAHPARPLPSGALSERTARWTVIIAIVAGLVSSALARPMLGVVTLVVVALMLAYSRWIKRWGLPGNLTVALLASLPFFYGGWSAGRPRDSLVLVALAMPLHFAREVAKDLEDATADAPARHTLPIVVGQSATRMILLGALVVFLAALGVFASERPLFAVAVIPAVLLAALATWRAFVGRRGSPVLFKSAMVLAMASLLVLRDRWTP